MKSQIKLLITIELLLLAFATKILDTPSNTTTIAAEQQNVTHTATTLLHQTR